MNTNPNLQAPYCTRCCEKIRDVWAIIESRKDGRNLCGLCRDDEMNANYELLNNETRLKLNDVADKLMKGWSER